jgi:hypothetical protein
MLVWNLVYLWFNRRPEYNSCINSLIKPLDIYLNEDGSGNWEARCPIVQVF